MKSAIGIPALPLPAFVLHPLTALFLGGVHVYLAAGHLSKLIGGARDWTDIWKGLGALAGAYIFVALASRGLAGRQAPRSADARLEAAIAPRVGATQSKAFHEKAGECQACSFIFLAFSSF